MAIDRGGFLQLAATALALGSAGSWGRPVRSGVLGCRSDGAARAFLTAVGADGQVLLDRALPGRGHGVALRPGAPECIVVARRPGTLLRVLDTRSAEVLHRLQGGVDRHFLGHGVFDPSGRWLYVTENAFEDARGLIGVYDAADGYRRLGELPSHGVDPHELKLLSDGARTPVAVHGLPSGRWDNHMAPLAQA